MDTKLVSADSGRGRGRGGGDGGKKSVTPPGIYVYYFLAIALGSDYTINLSSAPSYFSRISLFNATALSTSHDGLSNVSGLECNVLDFYSNTTASGDANYSYSLTLWSLGQFLGCIASIFMPPKLGNRVSFLVFVALSAVGNLMYGFADPSFTGSTSLALTGKFVNGFGDGSIALGMSYLPLYAPLDKKAEALVNYRTCGPLTLTSVACGNCSRNHCHPLIACGASWFSCLHRSGTFVSIGTAVGCGISIAIATTFVGSDTCINPGNLCTFINTGFFIAIFMGGFAINTKKPPTKGLNSFDRSFAAIFWICLNFFRGFCTQIGNAYVPTYAYTTETYPPFVASAFPSIVRRLLFVSPLYRLNLCFVFVFFCDAVVGVLSLGVTGSRWTHVVHMHAFDPFFWCFFVFSMFSCSLLCSLFFVVARFSACATCRVLFAPFSSPPRVVCGGTSSVATDLAKSCATNLVDRRAVVAESPTSMTVLKWKLWTTVRWPAQTAMTVTRRSTSIVCGVCVCVCVETSLFQRHPRVWRRA